MFHRLVDSFMKSNREILQTVPATDWDAVCIGLDSSLERIEIGNWAITELRQITEPPLRLVAGLDTTGEVFDELPEFRGYAHKSTPTEVAVVGYSGILPEIPWGAARFIVRIGRFYGLFKNSEYPLFETVVHETYRVKPKEVAPDRRRLLAIMPAINAHAVYSSAGLLEHQPIFVWALIEDVDRSHKVVGIDAETYPCDEWTNFVGYEPQPPSPEEFQQQDQRLICLG